MKFAQQLLSEFNLDWGLDAYVGYRDLKEIIKQIESDRLDVSLFFKRLNQDLTLVNLFYKQLETELFDKMTGLRGTPSADLEKESIFEAYNFGKAMHTYQNLNKEAFGKIIKKFQKRMGLRQVKRDRQDSENMKKPKFGPEQSIQLMMQCEQFLEEVEEAYYLCPTRLDLGGAFQELSIMYAECFSDGDEMLSAEVLEKVWSLDKRSQPRIIDYVDAHFYREKLRKREVHYACRIFSGRTNKPLARNVSRCLGHRQLGQAKVTSFANGEIDVQLLENIRGDDVFLFQATSATDSVSLAQAQMELLLLIHTCRLASAQRITAVMPYVAYQANDQPISAFANMIRAMGCDRFLTIDLLAGQIQGFFENIPGDNVKTVMEFAKYFKDKLEAHIDDWANQVCVVSPRSTSVERAREFADELGCGLATVIRRRKEEEAEGGLSWKFKEVTEIVGTVEGKVCIIMSCIVNEGDNLVSVAQQVKQAGAVQVFGCAVHGVFAGDAISRLNDSMIEEMIVTDTICQDVNMSRCPKLRVLPVAPLLAECIDRIHSEASIGAMMKARKPSLRTKSPGNSGRGLHPSSSSEFMEEEVMQQLENVDFRRLRRSREDSHVLSPVCLSQRSANATRKAVMEGKGPAE